MSSGWPIELEDWEVHPDQDTPINDPDVAGAKHRLDRLEAVSAFEKQTAKEIIEWSKKPEHVQLQEAGDYKHDVMEPEED